MDKYALRLANILAGNAEDRAAMEVTLGYGFKVRALGDVQIALTGGDLLPKINHEPAPMWRSLALKRDDILSFGSPRSGFRAYIALAGGIEAPFLMNSFSPMVGISGGSLKPGDRLKTGRQLPPGRMGFALPAHLVPRYENRIQLAVTLGPQDDFFTPDALERFLHSEYTITPQSNRQGYRLDGPVLKHVSTHDLISEAVWPGAVQIPGDGLPVILCVDAQTTGGYPKIASVVSADVDRLGQAKPSDRLSFRRISIEEAHRLYLEKEERVKDIRRTLWEKNG
jgi:biotin-dependent carboxylase-like uncharacterized protein